MTSQVTAADLVILALYQLGGGGTVVDTEDVAMRAHELGPGRFSWRKYPDQVNLEIVRVMLSNAHKSDNGNLVTGTGRSGWSLTDAGQRWAEANVGRLAGQDLSKPRSERSAGSIDERRWQRERRRMLTTDAWRQWNEADDASRVTLQAACEVFRIDRYVVGRSRELKINRIRELFADDDELSRFVEAAASVVQREERSGTRFEH